MGIYQYLLPVVVFTFDHWCSEVARKKIGPQPCLPKQGQVVEENLQEVAPANAYYDLLVVMQ